MLVRPRSSVTFPAWLPTGTSQWRCGFWAHVASIRERAVWRLMQIRWTADRFGLLSQGVRVLPARTGPDTRLDSGEFKVNDGPHNAQGGANGGQPSGAPWRRVSS